MTMLEEASYEIAVLLKDRDMLVNLMDKYEGNWTLEELYDHINKKKNAIIEKTLNEYETDID